MTARVAVGRPSEAVRAFASAAAGILLAVAILPFTMSWIESPELVATLRFAAFAVAIPALGAIGAPWRALGIRASVLERLARRRAARPQLWHAVVWLCLDVAVIVAWRTPALGDAVANHAWLVVPQAVTLLAAGVALWLELVASPPFAPRGSVAARGVLGAVAMWSIWTVAYVEGMSSRPWYSALHHAAGSGLSATADRQASAAALWAVTAACFLPLEFVCLFAWLRAESKREDPTAARLREEREGSAAGGLPTG